MTGRGAGNGTPGGRRPPGRGEAGGRGRGLGRGGRGTGGGRDAGEARLRRRDGSGRLESAATRTAGADVPAISSPAWTAAPVATPARQAQIAVAHAIGVARLTNADACIACGICVDVCPRSAIELDDLPEIHEALCGGCGECVEACPRAALTLVAA